jgi:hypothetical protein
MVIGG